MGRKRKKAKCGNYHVTTVEPVIRFLRAHFCVERDSPPIDVNHLHLQFQEWAKVADVVTSVSNERASLRAFISSVITCTQTQCYIPKSRQFTFLKPLDRTDSISEPITSVPPDNSLDPAQESRDRIVKIGNPQLRKKILAALIQLRLVMKQTKATTVKKRISVHLRDIAGTPAHIRDQIFSFFNYTGEYLDPCPIDPFKDGILIRWLLMAFVNPPFSEIALWILKALIEITLGHLDRVVMLLPLSPETSWWNQFVYPNATEVLYLGGIAFDGWDKPLRGCFVAVLFCNKPTRCYAKKMVNGTIRWHSTLEDRFGQSMFENIPSLDKITPTDRESCHDHQQRIRSLILETCPRSQSKSSGLLCQCGKDAEYLCYENCISAFCSNCKNMHADHSFTSLQQLPFPTESS
eukprot:TRINITY_DN632_c0_g1_i1.p1 TRINITY_DN632_c0_g1~~TRINITY_DN632_c0_g1_i1.p1  ORF type:complete len:406 (-),score=67.67 TRINITY_DN632_c0_g1_i1:9-1226(-)